MDSPTVVADLVAPPEPPREQPSSLELSVPTDIARDAATIVDTALSEAARAMLEFERQWWKQGGAKEQAIRDTFGLTPTRYYQSLNSVLDLPAAVQFDPALVHRLQRLRATPTRGRRLA